jgi:polyferredoxin
MMFNRLVLFIFLCVIGVTSFAADIERFPPPDFESGYTFPEVQTQPPRAEFMSYIDVAVLVGALSLMAFFVIKKRSRQGVFYLAIFSLLYFGFYRAGCVCAIGSIQNVTLGFFDSTYTVPLTVVAFFLFPLLFTLFFGRVFCSGVCPLGAMQDLVLLKSVKVPSWLQKGLGTIPYIYLGAAVLFAAMGSAFIICEYDPFVSFFRMDGNMNLVIFSGAILVISLFVGRPYCRFLCPYSVLLAWCSQLSQWRVTVGPDEGECVQCASCEEACPFGAITFPTPHTMEENTADDRKRIYALLLVAPVVILLGGWLVSLGSDQFAGINYTVRLAEQIALEDAGETTMTTDASQAFRDSGASKNELFTRANQIRDQFSLAAWLLGGFIGLVLIGKLIQYSIAKKREYYEADRGECVACGRCFCSCPLDRKWRKQMASLSAKKSTEGAKS